MMDHFGNAVKGSTAQPFLNEFFVFWSELNRHDSNLRPGARGFNSMISLRDADPPKVCARALKGRSIAPSRRLVPAGVVFCFTIRALKKRATKCLSKA